VVVGDDEDALADPGPPGRRGKCVRAREGVPSTPLDPQIREIVDPEERRARNVLLQVRLAPGFNPVERVAAVDELVADQ
jgi:hypothetical protein